MLEVRSRISQSELRRHRSCVEDDLVLAVVGRYALVARLGWADEEVSRVKINFTFEHFEGQDEVISEASAS